MAENYFIVVTEFILLGLADDAELKIMLFVLFLMIYFITLLGNLVMIFLIQVTPKLHTPMYFFPQLPILCRCLLFISHCTQNADQLLHCEENHLIICLHSAAFVFWGVHTTEGFLLSMMAYDCYVVIVNTFLYTSVMSERKCVVLVIGSYTGGMINSLTHTISLERLSFCGLNAVSHLCDNPSLLKLSCSDTSMNELLLLTFSGVIAMGIFLIVIISYTCIVVAILRVCSAAGRQKAFSTCASHLTAMIIFYGTLSFSYIQPSSQYTVEQEKVVSDFYTLVIPMLNSLIYSLRNRNVKDAMKRALEMKHFSC